MRDLTEAINIIKKWEGLKLSTYKCSAGIDTIGFGSTGPHVKPGMTITADEAEELLKKDLQRFVDALEKQKLEINDNQFAACVSLMFNTGIANFLGSTLLKKLKKKEYSSCPAEFMKWNKARVNGQLTVLKGLTNRREDEAKLFVKPVEPKATIAPVTHKFKEI